MRHIQVLERMAKLSAQIALHVGKGKRGVGVAHHCAANGVVSTETRLDVVEAAARSRVFHGGVVEDISRHAGRGAGRAGGRGRALYGGVGLLDHAWGGHHGRREGREEENREARRHGADG